MAPPLPPLATPGTKEHVLCQELGNFLQALQVQLFHLLLQPGRTPNEESSEKSQRLPCGFAQLWFLDHVMDFNKEFAIAPFSTGC